MIALGRSRDFCVRAPAARRASALFGASVHMLDALSECVRPSRLPTVDLAPFMVDEGVVVGESPTAAQLEAAQTIDSGCKEHGFLHAINFGLTPELEKEAFACARTLFSLPDSAKAKLSPIDPANGNQGFSPYLSEKHNLSRPPDLKEAFNTRHPKHLNRFDGCPDDFIAVTQKLWPIIEKASQRYAIALALALGLEEGGYSYFRQTLSELDLCILRFNHYPPCDAPADPGGDTSLKSIRIGEHTDFGVRRPPRLDPPATCQCEQLPCVAEPCSIDQSHSFRLSRRSSHSCCWERVQRACRLSP